MEAGKKVVLPTDRYTQYHVFNLIGNCIVAPIKCHVIVIQLELVIYLNIVFMMQKLNNTPVVKQIVSLFGCKLLM